MRDNKVGISVRYLASVASCEYVPSQIDDDGTLSRHGVDAFAKQLASCLERAWDSGDHSVCLCAPEIVLMLALSYCIIADGEEEERLLKSVTQFRNNYLCIPSNT